MPVGAGFKYLLEVSQAMIIWKKFLPIDLGHCALQLG